MKVCNLCKCNKPAEDFYKKIGSKDGLFWWCKACHRSQIAARYHAKATSEEYRAAEKERLKKWRLDNSDKVKSAHIKYATNNKPKLNAKAKKYVMAREKRTPCWLQEDDFWLMEQAYELASLRTRLFGFRWDVDHIVPLHGKLVSGLHVPHNLQVLPAKSNRDKSNKFVVT
jgi:hypothetical protein